MKYFTKINLEKNVLEIYTIKPNKPKIKKYKEEELTKIPYEEKVMLAYSGYVEGYSDGVPACCDSIQKEKWPIIAISGNDFRSTIAEKIIKYKEIETLKNEKIKETFLQILLKWPSYEERVRENINKYIKGDFAKSPAKIIRRFQSNDKEYFIVTSDYKWSPSMYRDQILEYMNDLIRLTPELYKLHCLETYDFESLIYLNIDEQLKLFDLELVGSIDLKAIQDLEKYQIIPNASSIVYSRALK